MCQLQFDFDSIWYSNHFQTNKLIFEAVVVNGPFLSMMSLLLESEYMLVSPTDVLRDVAVDVNVDSDIEVDVETNIGVHVNVDAKSCRSRQQR